MQEDALKRWRHDHSFGQDRRRPGERKTHLVIAITAAMMVVEIAAGVLFGSMALLADGLHMASHAVALGINAYAYAYARRHAHDASFSFGTGKVNTLGGFTGAILLAAFALLMASESVQRLVVPVAIAFDQAILVAVVGLVVNGVSMLILGHRHANEHDHDDHDEHDHGLHDHEGHAHEHHEHADHNLLSAYLHVLADALTSLLAIVALLAAKYFGLTWMDPLMGIVGALLVARWSLGLLRATSAVLLDRSAAPEVCAAIREGIERVDGNSVADLHVWCIGLNLYAVELAVVAAEPQPPEHYKALLPPGLNIVHATVEVHARSR
ncbi:MAG TPA: CDF family Co(II)/Ni(II) efflux transporter DmeF [Gammaproteobacteria bacterium]|nr:CDF family Co(II)/Ni(II) efflux transporter DmeF [Gammaproteobacteria bacterium]